MQTDKGLPYIQICTLDAVRETDIRAYDGVITIEDTTIEDPFRVEASYPPQLVLRFDDISRPFDDYVLPEIQHVRSALEFAEEWGYPSLLIHCHAGMSRSPAIALAIIANCLGVGTEQEAVRELLKIVPLCTPNKLLVEIIDSELNRNGGLIRALNLLC